MIYIELALVAIVTIYIVDLSGFTDSWRSALARYLHTTSLRAIKPFDCGKCMTWWVCLAFSIASGEFNIFTLAYCAALSFFSLPIGRSLLLAREWINTIISNAFPR